MERSQLLYVLETARTGNITHAAENLHITQPSLSNQIIKLEEELGIKLFERRRKRLLLTEAGEAFCAKARIILEGFDALSQEMNDFAHKKFGYLQIGVLSIMIPMGMADIINDYRLDHPDYKLTISENASNDLLNMIRNGDLDVAILTLPANFHEDLIQTEFLFDNKICAVINTANPLSEKEVLNIEDLKDQNLIMNTVNFNLQNQILLSLDAKEIPYRIVIRCNQVDSGIALASKNYGISFASQLVVNYYHYPNIRHAAIANMKSRGIYIAYKKDPAYYPVLAEFISYIKDTLKDRMTNG